MNIKLYVPHTCKKPIEVPRFVSGKRAVHTPLQPPQTQNPQGLLQHELNSLIIEQCRIPSTAKDFQKAAMIRESMEAIREGII